VNRARVRRVIGPQDRSLVLLTSLGPSASVPGASAHFVGGMAVQRSFHLDRTAGHGICGVSMCENTMCAAPGVRCETVPFCSAILKVRGPEGLNAVPLARDSRWFAK